MTNPAQDELAPEVAPCHVGLVFALAMEAGGFEDLLSGALTIKGPGLRIRQAGLHGRNVALVVGGPGREAAARATDVLIAGHQPRLVIAAGFAGGLSPSIKRGDLVLGDGVTSLDGRRMAIEFQLSARLMNATRGLHVGRVLTVDRVIHAATEKQSLGEQHGALAVDMETYAVAQVCARYATPCLPVRVISDAAEDELPHDIERLLRAQSVLRRMGAVTGTIFRRPSSVKDLWKLKEDALVGSDRLARFLDALVAELPM